jgi:hypothetical protein
MSEQQGPQPLYIVVATIRSVSVAQRDDEGVYRIALEMRYPFDRPETAQQLCDLLTALDVPLEIPASPGMKGG